MAIDNYRRFYAILRQMPQLYSRDEQKRLLVLQYTNGRRQSPGYDYKGVQRHV